MTTPHVTIVRPLTRGVPLDVRELWQYRELLHSLVVRSIKVRYKQTLLGATWAILQPVLTMVVLSVLLGRLARIPSDGIPYPLFAYAGLVVWMFFVNASTQATQSLVEQQQLITRVYFPRVLLPLAAVVGTALDVLLTLPVLIGIMAFYGTAPTAYVWMAPLFLLLAAAAAFGVGLWLSALNVRYRDVRYAIPFLFQLWLFATPVVYPSSLLPGRWSVPFGINPMAGVVEGFRWALLGGTPFPTGQLVVSVSVMLVVLAGGLFCFRRMEATFADLV